MPSMIAFFLLAAIIAIAKEASAVFDGQYVQDMSQFPYLARINGANGAFRCTGSILSANYVLSAAHCVRSTQFYALAQNQTGVFLKVTDIRPDIVLTVQVNSTDVRSADTIEVNVTHLAVPPNYPFPNGFGFVSVNPTQWELDMVIYKLETPLNFSANVQPVNLLNDAAYQHIPESVKNQSLIAGWGGNDTYRLVYGTWAVAPTEVCANESVTYYNYWQNVRNLTGKVWTPEMLEQVRVNMTQAINEGLICGLPNPSNMEGGNSGGPSAVKGQSGKNYQIGITSNNFSYSSAASCAVLPNCTLADPAHKPMIYTRVSVSCDWFASLTHNEVKCKENFN